MPHKMFPFSIKKRIKEIRAFVLRTYYNHLVGKINEPVIFCECYLLMNKTKLRARNWGDDLNIFLFEQLTGKKVINIPFSKMNNKGFDNVYSLIGSILDFYDLEGKIIYGSGIQNPQCMLRGKPKKIISVRGPKTRDIFLQQGIICPENYGDPALLLPCIYKFNEKKHNRPVIIPNMGTFSKDISIIKNIANSLDAIILDLRSYKKWTDPIDIIAGASYIISESLHGLIVAESYCVPNVWVSFIPHPEYWNFKFEDYYKSIKKEESIIEMRDISDMEIVQKKLVEWKRGCIEYEKLMNLFPFQIEKNDFLKG